MEESSGGVGVGSGGVGESSGGVGIGPEEWEGGEIGVLRVKEGTIGITGQKKWPTRRTSV